MDKKTITPKDFDGDSKKFLVEDYKLKVAYLQSHFSRMWTRFNFLLTIELALFGLIGYLLFDTSGRDVEATIVPIFLGLVASFLWYFIGAQDRYLVEAYREDIEGLARIIAAFQAGLAWYADHYVGSKNRLPPPFGSQKRSNLWDRLTGWYRESISITRLAAIIPMVLFVLWSVALVMRLGRYSIFSGA